MDGRLLDFKLALVAFWAAWFALALLGNVFGGLKAAGQLPASWRFASSNYEAVVRATAMYRPPPWLPAFLFAGVVSWQLIVALLLGWATASSFVLGRLNLLAVDLGLGAGIALWGAFMLADEVTLKYEFERTHELLFIAQLASLLAIHLLP